METRIDGFLAPPPAPFSGGHYVKLPVGWSISDMCILDDRFFFADKSMGRASTDSLERSIYTMRLLSLLRCVK